VLEKVKDAGEAGKQLSLRDGKLSNFNAQNIVCLLEESAERCVVFDVEEGAEVGFEGIRLIAKDEHLRRRCWSEHLESLVYLREI
jgi:hypothetical protein